jgi:hypothetical protein
MQFGNSDNAPELNRKNMEERIKKVSAEYEKELERKKKLYDEIGDAEVFTPEDFEFMLNENEMFRGKNVDLTQVQKYNKLSDAARWLDAKHTDVIKIDCPPLPTGRAGYIGVDINDVSFFGEDVKRILAGMVLLCDNLTVSGLKEGVVHLSFGISGQTDKAD